MTPNLEPKSISNETTFAEDTRSKQQLVTTLRRLSDKVAARLRKQHYRTRTVSLKLRYASFATYSRQTSFPEPTDDGDTIFERVRTLFEEFPLDESIRLIGVGTSNLMSEDEKPAQLELFASPQRVGEKLSHALDEIHERFGEDSLHRASDLS